MTYMRGMTRLCEGRHDEARAELARAEAAGAAAGEGRPRPGALGDRRPGPRGARVRGVGEAEDHFRRALAALPDDAPSARRQAVRADLLLGLARAVAPTERADEALALLRRAFAMGMASGCSMGRKVAAHAALSRATRRCSRPASAAGSSRPPRGSGA